MRLKGFLQFCAGSRSVIWYTENSWEQYDDLMTFLNKIENADVYVKSDMYTMINKYMERKEIEVIRSYYPPLKKNEDPTGLKLMFLHYGTNYIYDLKRRTGTDQYKSFSVMFKEIQKCSNKPLAGYTTKLSKMLKTNEARQNFCAVDYRPSMAPLIYVRKNKEFTNVHTYDMTSQYPFLLTRPLPKYDKPVKIEEMDVNSREYTYYGKLIIHNVHLKYPYLPTLTLRYDRQKHRLESGQGEEIVNNNASLVAAKRVEIYGFLPFLLEALEEYKYDSYEIAGLGKSNMLRRFRLEVDEELKKVVLELFEAKENARGTQDYEAIKILLNRVYGYFITKGKKSPAHYGQFVVAKAKILLRRMAYRIGLNDVIHIHTDGIKFVGDHEDAIEEYNAIVPYEKLGKFHTEGTWQRCCYFKTNTAKYIDEEGHLCFKHGGISEEGLTSLFSRTYDEITKDTEIYVQYGGIYTDEVYKVNGQEVSGYIPLISKRKLGGKYYDKCR